jgi:hypothetical protein
MYSNNAPDLVTDVVERYSYKHNFKIKYPCRDQKQDLISRKMGVKGKVFPQNNHYQIKTNRGFEANFQAFLN